jgi:hypothetical protein
LLKIDNASVHYVVRVPGRRIVKIRISAAVLVVVIGSAGADAQSLNDRLYRTEDEEILAKGRYVRQANDQCGTQLAAQIDWTEVPPEFAGKDLPPRPDGKAPNRGRPSGYCFNVFAALESICKTEAGKTAVKQRVRNIVCGFGPERTIELKDGVLTFKMNVNTYNNEDFVREYLLNNL